MTAIMLPNLKARLALRLYNHRCFCHHRPPALLLKGHTHQFEQPSSLFVSASRCYDAHFHTANLINLVVVDLGKDQLFAQAKRVVATTIEGFGGDTLKVSYAGRATLMSLSRNWYMRSPRSVTMHPICIPSRSLKVATERLARVMTGR